MDPELPTPAKAPFSKKKKNPCYMFLYTLSVRNDSFLLKDYTSQFSLWLDQAVPGARDYSVVVFTYTANGLHPIICSSIFGIHTDG